jgi:enterochelin esterase-like enzyme
MPTAQGARRALVVRGPASGTDVRMTLWTAAGLAADEAAPLLVVHDGPEYDRAADLTGFLAAGVAAGRFPPLRAALLDPGDRDRRYGADPGYARDLATAVLPALSAAAPVLTTTGMGTSLGALAMLHAHREYPAVFDRLFLQSGSFFDPRYDAHEARFAGYRRIVEFVATVRATPPRWPVHVVLTCGVDEENLENNRRMAETLAAQEYPAELHEVPGGHDFPSWRGAFDPYLARLLSSTL